MRFSYLSIRQANTPTTRIRRCEHQFVPLDHCRHHRTGIRLHQRVPRHRQRHGDLHRQWRAGTQGCRRIVRRAQLGGRLHVHRCRGHHRQGPRRGQRRHTGTGVRRIGRRHRLEPAHLALRYPLEFLARADRRHRGRHDRRRRRTRSDLEERRFQGAHPGRRRRDPGRARRGDRHLAGLPDYPRCPGQSAPRPGSATASGARLRWSRWRTAPATPRRRWASSSWR